MSAREKVNILLVDDQPSRLLSYEAILADLGQNLVCARSGTEALQQLMKDDFAAILLDVSMPDMDGFETAALIHRHPRFERTPIIFVTAVHVTDFDRLKGYELGAFDYVYVPVVPEILRGKVQVLVELYAKRRELLRLNAALERTNAELAAANSALQAERAEELQQLNEILARANSELARANLALQAEIAERARAEAALQDADRRKDEFLATLAHELRNPLAPISNAVGLLELEGVDPTRVEHARGVVKRQVRQLVRLVDDLLDISRITHGSIELRRETVPLASIVDAALEVSLPLIRAANHELVVSLPPGPVFLDADPVRLSQVVSNLLNNAAKYTPDGGRIELTAEVGPGHDDGSTGRELVIRVRDSGVGIAPEVLPQIFEMFSQASRSRDRAQGGLGIGLALVQRLVELHDGRVEGRSDGPGRGSEFTVRLPAAALAAEAPALAPNTGTTLAAGFRVLVVDDNQDAADSLSLLLEMLGHQVRTAHDGAEALRVAREFHPEVAVLDLGMPGLSGYAVARQLRGEPWGGELLLIALTGWGQEEAKHRTREAGFDYHVVKPLDADALHTLLVSAKQARSGTAARTAAAG
jgi:signal transduction histidine kinase